MPIIYGWFSLLEAFKTSKAELDTALPACQQTGIITDDCWP